MHRNANHNPGSFHVGVLISLLALSASVCLCLPLSASVCLSVYSSSCVIRSRESWKKRGPVSRRKEMTKPTPVKRRIRKPRREKQKRRKSGETQHKNSYSGARTMQQSSQFIRLCGLRKFEEKDEDFEGFVSFLSIHRGVVSPEYHQQVFQDDVKTSL